MRIALLFILIPFFSYSQSRIEFYLNDTIINDQSACFLYVNIDSNEYNLLDENLFSLLLDVDSFRVEGNIQGVEFKSSRLNIMKMVSDSLRVKCYFNIDGDKTGLRIRCAPTPKFHEVHIYSLRDDCTYYVSNWIRMQDCLLKPAYILDGKQIFDEVPEVNKTRKKAYRKRKRTKNSFCR